MVRTSHQPRQPRTGRAAHIASGWASYRFTSGPFEGLGPGGGVRYISRPLGKEANGFRVPGPTLVDAAIRSDMTHRDGCLAGKELTLNVSNLFDRRYVSSCSSSAACRFGDRRTVLAGLRLK